MELNEMILDNCRLCYSKPGKYEIHKDTNLIKDIFENTTINVNDEAKDLLPCSICNKCKGTIKKINHYKDLVKNVDRSLRKLLERSQLQLDDSNDLESSNSVLQKCDLCPAVFGDELLFKEHTESHLSNFECNRCKKLFNSKSSLEAHNLVHHENSTDVDSSEALNCKICNKNFKTEGELSNHLIMHTVKYTCTWENCGKVCTSAYSLKNHKLRHEGKRPFLCVTCGKGFITKNSLSCHEKTHLEVKAHTCKICDIGFSVRSNLRAHEKNYHEGIRFYCSQCTRVFMNKCSLERHEKIHAGVKEFQCESCPAAFYTRKELVKHGRYHLGLKLYKCETCFKTFFEKHHLVIHLRSHTGERPYVCQVPGCGKSFTESQKLKRHQNAKHSHSQN